MTIRYLIFLLFCNLGLFADKPSLLLLKTYKEQNITGWVMSEKLDGIRAYWDGKHLLTRQGKTIHAPKYFIDACPPFEIDGELWTKRGDFENISSIVRDKHPSSGWREVTYNIFEVPHTKGGLAQRLNKAKPYEGKIIKIIPQILIKNKSALKKFLVSIEKKGGEGVVVRDPKAPYIAKRTSKALKVKSFLDRECTIVAYNKGHGKYKGLMGSIQCQMDDNTTFNIGSGFNDKQRQIPPAIGSVITFKYKEMTKYNKPRFPVFLRVRYMNKSEKQRQP